MNTLMPLQSITTSGRTNSSRAFFRPRHLKCNFSGHAKAEKNDHVLITGGLLRQETAFCREPETLEFVKTYLKDKQNISVADFACSTGEEAYTLAMLLHQNNKEKNIDITGYDLGDKAVEDAKKGAFVIRKMSIENKMAGDMMSAYKDSYLAFPSDKPLNEKQLEYKTLFERFFQEVEPPNQSLKQEIKEQFKKAALYFKNKAIAFCMNKVMKLPIDPHLFKSPTFKDKYFEIRPEKKNLCQFKTGDITKIDEFLEPNSTDVVLFRNALYHLTTTEPLPGWKAPKEESEIESILQDLFKRISATLSTDGLFVLGTHGSDHDLGHGELIYRLLEDNGFKAVHYDDGKPSVWQKTQSKKP